MRLPLLLALLLTAPALAEERCRDQVPCRLGDRSYHVREPDGWDGVSPLPVLLHFHGWQRQGTLVVRHARIAGATRRRGVLLLAPNGPGKSWDWWNRNTENVGFAAAVIEDAARRYPIDRSRIFVSGYSWGAAMAWRYVCNLGDGVAALLSIGGTLDQSEDCPEAPREVRHVHGLTDTVMPYPTGRAGDLMEPVALWRRKFGCRIPEAQGNYQIVSWLTFTRFVWTDCERGKVILDQHPGGHFIPHGWIGRQLDELLGRAPNYP